MSTNRWGRMAEMLAARTAGTVQNPARPNFNPKPHGSMLPGGVTELVLAHLAARRGAKCSLASIARAIGRSVKTTSWALVVLRHRRLIDRILVDGDRRALWFAVDSATGGGQSRSEHGSLFASVCSTTLQAGRVSERVGSSPRSEDGEMN